VGWFRKREETEPLPVTMAGIRLGDRLLAVGVRDPALVAALARKTGLTGRVCAIDADEARVAKAAAEIEREGALAEVTRVPWGLLPFEADSFDVAVARDLLHSMTRDVRSRCLDEVYRVLRPGGRVVVIEPAPRGGIGSLLSRNAMDPEYHDRGGPAAALTGAGFAAVRVIAERDGVVYAEGAKRV
jgi:ubiquinone/menaquinone biosynthesis C-methylase UbiE